MISPEEYELVFEIVPVKVFKCPKCAALVEQTSLEKHSQWHYEEILNSPEVQAFSAAAFHANRILGI